jgi:capsular exopolysaccharide synthesis family protein
MTAALHRRQLIEGAAFVGPAEDPPPATLELLAVIWRRKGLVFAAALATLMAAGAVLSLIPKRYEAVAEVLVEPKAPKVLSFDEVVPGPDIADISPASEVRMILSPESFARAVDRLRLTEDPEFNPASMAEPGGLVAWTRAKVVEALGWRAPAVFANPDTEARAERALAIRNLRGATVVYPVDKSRVVAIRVSSVRPDKAALIANTLVDLHLRAQLEERRASAKRAAEWLEERLGELTTAARDAVDRADAFRSGEAATAGISTEAAAALLRELVSALAYARADGQENRAATLERAADALRDDLRRIARIEAELAQLEEQAAAAKSMQSAFRLRLAETRAQADVQRLDARMVAAATAPLRPASPNTRMILALALAGGLTLGAGFATNAESHRAPFRTVRQVEASLGLPVAATVPRAPGIRPNAVRYGRNRPGSRLAEAVRDMRVLVDRPCAGEATPPRVVALASARPGEGKSTLAALLAESLARSGRRTLLIDCDLRRPTTAKLYRLEAAEDLIAVLDGEVSLDEAIWSDPASGVSILTAQPCPPKRSDLLATPAFAALIETARKRFDAVVLDTPPTLALSDARLASAEADAVIFAVRWADTPQEEAIAALRMLQEAGAKMAGVALTHAGRGVDLRINIAGGRARYGRFSEYFTD